MNNTLWGVIGGGVLFFLIVVGYIIYAVFIKRKDNGMHYTPPKKTNTKSGGINMDKLEEEVFKEFKEAYNDMIDEIKRAERENDGIDLKDFVKSQAERFQNLNNHFREAKIRMGGK